MLFFPSALLPVSFLAVSLLLFFCPLPSVCSRTFHPYARSTLVLLSLFLSPLLLRSLSCLCFFRFQLFLTLALYPPLPFFFTLPCCWFKPSSSHVLRSLFFLLWCTLSCSFVLSPLVALLWCTFSCSYVLSTHFCMFWGTH